ncbi:hypothetical protein CRUP_014083, partial [Coryphaenoides rupestris]
MDPCGGGNHGCEHDYFSTEDSCVCRCRRGYVLRPDGKTCKKVDHCADGGHGCQHEAVNAETACVCECRDGFTLEPDGRTCRSLDLCQTVDHGCEHQCLSTPESYLCVCFEGFTLAGDGRSCKKPECGAGVMDLVFVIDGSKSLGPVNFELVKRFVNTVVDSLDVSRSGAHVGLLQYSTKVRTEFPLGRYTSGRDVKAAVSRVEYMGRGSMTGSALRHLHQPGGRPAGGPAATIVLTDGRSQDDVAIEEELKQIASEPDEKHVFYADNFDQMGEITNRLKSGLCQ